MGGNMTQSRLCQLLLTVVVLSLICQVSGKGVQILRIGRNIADDTEANDEDYTSITTDQQSNVTDDLIENDGDHYNISNQKSSATDTEKKEGKSIITILQQSASTDCGGELNSDFGIIRHPISDGNYLDNEYCTWTIRASNPITITFINFKTEWKVDYLYVWDGESIGSPVLGNFTGNNIPPSVKTSAKVAHLRFTSDYSITNTGFELYWQTIGCGGVFNTNSGIIRHPNSGNYAINEDCLWIIRASTRINITFVRFNTESKLDHLYVRYVENNASNVIGDFTGDKIPSTVASRTNVTQLHFTSDFNITKTGFELYWQSGSFRCPHGFIMSGFYQCFKMFKDRNRNFDQAVSKCRSEGLQMAEAIDAVAIKLREDLLSYYGSKSITWMGARGNGSSYIWQSDGRVIRTDNPLFWSGSTPSNTSNYCLVMFVHSSHMTTLPKRPYYGRYTCQSTSYKTLCELV